MHICKRSQKSFLEVENKNLPSRERFLDLMCWTIKRQDEAINDAIVIQAVWSYVGCSNISVLCRIRYKCNLRKGCEQNNE